jgi:hypothetical protein
MIGVDTRVDQLIEHLPGLLREISSKDDAQIIRIAITAQRLERFAFLVRGMCASELRRRHPLRLSGGRGKRDRLELGVQAQMTRLAKEAGVDRRTLETDARIKDTFFPVISETTFGHMPSLAREYYVIALSAPDPLAALKTAVEMRSEADFTLRQFRAEVRLLKNGTRISLTDAISQRPLALHIHLAAVVCELITDLTTKTGMSMADIVADAVRMLHASLSQSPKPGTRTPNSARTIIPTDGDKQLKLEI